MNKEKIFKTKYYKITLKRMKSKSKKSKTWMNQKAKRIHNKFNTLQMSKEKLSMRELIFLTLAARILNRPSF